jgi:hypothetical protein
MKALIARPVGVPVPDATQSKPVGQPANGLQVYTWTAPLGHEWFNGTCYADLMNRSAMRYFLEQAYEPYYKRYKEDYGQLVMAEFTDEPCTIFRRRLPAGAVPYTDELFDCFRKMYGYEPVEKLHLLFVDQPEAERFRLDYFRTVNHLFENNFSRQLGRWCDEHGIDLTGHYMCEHSLYSQQLWGVNVMPNYRHQGIPGIDHLGRQINERITAKQCHSIVNQYGKKRMLSELYGASGSGLSFEDRLWIASQQICLGVNLLNPHLSLYTMAGCRKRDYPPNLFYQQPWWPLNREIDEPLARLCVALSQGRYHAEALIVHPQESVLALWKSKWQIKDSSLIGLGGNDDWDWEPTVDGVKETVAALDEQVKTIIDVLLGCQHTFDLGDEKIMAEAGEVVTLDSDSPPYLRIGQMDYPVVILPAMITIAQTTFDLLKEFQQAGGAIFRCGRKPRLLDGQPNSELDKWLKQIPEVELPQLPAKIRTTITPAVELLNVETSNAQMLWSHVRNLKGGERLVFLTNLDRFKEFDDAVRFAGQWSSVYLLDFWTGRQQKVACQADPQGLRVNLHFSPVQSYLLLLSSEQNFGEEVSLVSSQPSRSLEIPANQWEVERLDDNAITLDYAHWRQGDDQWSFRPLPVIAIQRRLNELKYNGPLTLRYNVKVKNLDLNRKVRLVVEYPERYHISVNGEKVEYNGLPFWRDIRWLPIDITGRLQEGNNVIQMHCEHFQYGNPSSIEDQFARYGTEIESIYIVGDFGVFGEAIDDKPVSPQWNEFGLPPVNIRCFREDSFYLSEPAMLKLGDTTVQGLAFYAGRVQLKAKLPVMDKNSYSKVLLCIDHLDVAAAEVLIDNRKVGSFVSHPFQVDLTKAVAEGGREVKIVLYGTLRNLMGPHHHINGELPVVGPENFVPSFEEEEDFACATLRWMKGQTEPADWRDRYCMISSGSLGRIYFEWLK